MRLHSQTFQFEPCKVSLNPLIFQSPSKRPEQRLIRIDALSHQSKKQFKSYYCEEEVGVDKVQITVENRCLIVEVSDKWTSDSFPVIEDFNTIQNYV